MEIKIGVKQSPREIVIEVEEDNDTVRDLVTRAIADSSVLSLTDSKGRQVIVPVDALAYVETGGEQTRRVGFGAI